MMQTLWTAGFAGQWMLTVAVNYFGHTVLGLASLFAVHVRPPAQVCTDRQDLAILRRKATLFM